MNYGLGHCSWQRSVKRRPSGEAARLQQVADEFEPEHAMTFSAGR
jgi:hypothetical protein